MSILVVRNAAAIVFAAFLCTALAACGFLGGSTEDLSVTRYDGPAITAANASRGWSATVKGDEITLEHTDPDVVSESVLVTLRGVEEALPELHEVWVGPLPGRGHTMKEATLRIQDWNVQGVLSGKLEGKLLTGGKLSTMFWVNLADSATSQNRSSP